MTAISVPIRPNGRGRLLDLAALTMTGTILGLLVIQWVPILVALGLGMEIVLPLGASCW